MEASVSDDVIDVLRKRFGPLEHIGAGAWSTAFRFHQNGNPMVVRVGRHVEDFDVDAEMSAFSSRELPIPIVAEVASLESPHEHLSICVSSFAKGIPIEAVPRGEWAALVPAVADLFDALRAVSPPSATNVRSWPDVLLAESDNESGRMRGWRDLLAARPGQHEAYEKSRDRLRELSQRDAVVAIKPTLLHCDLVNRNVHVSDGRITGVFDWGCRRWGDHLFDFAWFVFWEPWMENLDVGLLRSELVDRWGAEPHPERLAACLLQIGADHLAYNAFAGDEQAGHDLEARITELGLLEEA